MNYYNDKKNVEEYIRMAEGYDGRAFVELLKGLLPEGASVLELGMGPGKDLLLLDAQVSRSPARTVLLCSSKDSALYIRMPICYSSTRVTLETERTFDCIYSNKVLIHLAREELREFLSPAGEIAQAWRSAVPLFLVRGGGRCIFRLAFCVLHPRNAGRNSGG